MDDRELSQKDTSVRKNGDGTRSSQFRRAPAQSASSSAGRKPTIIAIANQKGGVAKTTTVVSLGGALVRHGQEVLLIDLDAQANLTLALGKDPTRVRGSIADVLFNSATLLSVSRETTIPGLDLVPSNAGMELAERFLPVRKDYESILRRAIQDALNRKADRFMALGDRTIQDYSTPGADGGNSAAPGRQPAVTEHPESQPVRVAPPLLSASPPTLVTYDYIILDCPPFMGAVTLNALIAADMLIIPTQPEYFSAHALRTMMATVRQVRNQHNPKLVYRILITMIDRRNRIHREVHQQIRDAFGEGIFKAEIGIDTKLRESAVEGVPISHFKAESRSAQQYDDLAEELIEYVR
ncbi:MAG: ParA family protein [Anaerolineales bacterium]|nr:ParA family protein [Anaerolineales bacterium]